MKKKLLFLTFLLAAFTMQAQYSIVDQNNNEIYDGMVFETGSLEYDLAELQFFVTNEGADSINMRIEFVSSVNADGTGFQLCFGQCYIDLEIGQTVPPMPNFIEIAPGDTTGEGNHFYNSYAGNGSDVQEYVFRFHETDADGNDIGNSLFITYIYNPNLGTNDFNALDVNIASTVIQTNMQVNTAEELTMEVYDLKGALVKKQLVEAGQHSINMADLNPQLYIIKFNNAEGASKTVKVVVK